MVVPCAAARYGSAPSSPNVLWQLANVRTPGIVLRMTVPTGGSIGLLLNRNGIIPFLLRS